MSDRLVYLVVILAALGLAGGIGHKFGVVGMQQLQADREREWNKYLAAERVRGDELAAKLDREKGEIRVEIREVVKLIPQVTTVYRDRPGDALKPIPPAIYTRGYVGLWNDALGASERRAAAATGGAAGATEATDPTRAEIDSSDLAANHAANAEICRDTRAQLNALIDWHEKQQAR